ncbi:hypothetical protein MJL79_32520, partial [Salmonella enterica subsp. enterica serovar Montevideo]|nr:hypothetical protein [Salmonella enterica subsp. enterica serovar Montevideo]
IDAILVDRLAALDLVKKTKGTLAVTGDAFSRQESGVALRKGNVEHYWVTSAPNHFSESAFKVPSFCISAMALSTAFSKSSLP